MEVTKYLSHTTNLFSWKTIIDFAISVVVFIFERKDTHHELKSKFWTLWQVPALKRWENATSKAMFHWGSKIGGTDSVECFIDEGS